MRNPVAPADNGLMHTDGRPAVGEAPAESAAAARIAAQVDRHTPALDGVRGIAILVVMAYHYLTGEHHLPGLKQFFEAAHSGWLGVDLFFVLSGFLITGILIK